MRAPLVRAPQMACHALHASSQVRRLLLPDAALLTAKLHGLNVYKPGTCCMSMYLLGTTLRRTE